MPISQPLQADLVFPPMVGQMVKIGEERASSTAMLGKVADFYEDQAHAHQVAGEPLSPPMRR